MGGGVKTLISVLCLLSCNQNETENPRREGIHFDIQVGKNTTRASAFDSLQTSGAEPLSIHSFSLVNSTLQDSLNITAVETPWMGGIINNRETIASPERKTTKAAPVTNNAFHSSMGVFHYTFKTWADFEDVYLSKREDWVGKSTQFNAGTYEGVTLPTSFENIKLIEGSGWRMDPQYTWEDDKEVQYFVCYAPYSESFTSLSPLSYIGSGMSGYPSFKFTVPSNVKDQVDFVIGGSWWYPKAMEPEYTDPLPVVFFHQLTGVRFIAKDMAPGSVTKISLKGVYSQGTWTSWPYDVDSDYWKEQHPMTPQNWGDVGTDHGKYLWQELTKPADFSHSFVDGFTITGTEKQTLNPDELTFMMLPQTLPEGATIEVEYTDFNGDTQTFSASLAGTKWIGGNMVEYNISKAGVGSHFEVIPPVDFSYKGGTNSLSVKSYSVGADHTATTLPFTIDFVSENPDGTYSTIQTPSWIQMGTSSYTGDATPQSVDITVSARTPDEAITGNMHNKTLYEASAKGNSTNPYNLSNHEGLSSVENTANCYIINAPGYYSLPLVYGNAVKKGETNSASYTSSTADSQIGIILHQFVNHLDRPVTDPYIYNNRDTQGSLLSPESAVLVWQDAQDLVSNIGLSEDHHSLVFEVPQGNITQGNALLAVRDNDGQIMWSWHIWVTDYVPGLPSDMYDEMRDKTVHNGTDNAYDFMPINLGWCDNAIDAYPHREALARVTQTKTGRSVVFKVYQSEFDGRDNRSQTLYQWGRKDPMLPLVSTWSGDDEVAYSDKPSFTTEQNLTFTMSKGPVSIGEAIRNPNHFYDGSNRDYHPSGISLREDDSYSSWCTDLYTNLWSANIDQFEGVADLVTKTIYDPCPVGYRMAYPRVWRGFASENHYTDQLNTPYTDLDSEVKAYGGYEFYCNPMPSASIFDPTGGTIFFPTTGSRQPNNRDIQYNTYWTAGSWVGTGEYIPIYRPSDSSEGPSFYALAVRPIKE